MNASIWEMLERCPHLHEDWKRSRRERMDINDDAPLPYLQAAALAEIVVGAYSQGDKSCLPGLFDRLEELLAERLDDHDLLVAGFIEDLQGELGWQGIDAAEIHRWLGPLSQRAWDGLIEAWEQIERRKATGELPPGLPMPDAADPQLRKLIRWTYRPPRKSDTPRDPN